MEQKLTVLIRTIGDVFARDGGRLAVEYHLEVGQRSTTRVFPATAVLLSREVNCASDLSPVGGGNGGIDTCGETAGV